MIGCIILGGVFYAMAAYTYLRGKIAIRGSGTFYRGEPGFRMALIVTLTIGSAFLLFGVLSTAKII
ncbi:MAG: hypothetical protein JWN40_1954 [Phycisphaerales bacterium]|jgi:hypothetical protein|nr:hypothetical protein [Phycisphaerales bacterium]